MSTFIIPVTSYQFINSANKLNIDTVGQIKFLHYAYSRMSRISSIPLVTNDIISVSHSQDHPLVLICLSFHYTLSPDIPAARNHQEQGKGRVGRRGAESTPNSAGFGCLLRPPGAFLRPPSSPTGPLGMLHHLQDMAARQMRRETEELRGSARRTILPWSKHKAH